jgi:hypothetical protein
MTTTTVLWQITTYTYVSAYLYKLGTILSEYISGRYRCILEKRTTPRRTNTNAWLTEVICATLQTPNHANLDRSATGGFLEGIEKTIKGWKDETGHVQLCGRF